MTITKRKILRVRKLDDTQILCLEEKKYNYLYNNNIYLKMLLVLP